MYVCISSLNYMRLYMHIHKIVCVHTYLGTCWCAWLQGCIQRSISHGRQMQSAVVNACVRVPFLYVCMYVYMCVCHTKACLAWATNAVCRRECLCEGAIPVCIYVCMYVCMCVCHTKSCLAWATNAVCRRECLCEGAMPVCMCVCMNDVDMVKIGVSIRTCMHAYMHILHEQKAKPMST